MKKAPFKMKGNPMKRNFGISPMKHGIHGFGVSHEHRQESKKIRKARRKRFVEKIKEYLPEKIKNFKLPKYKGYERIEE